jgi:hypothetical protein
MRLLRAAVAAALLLLAVRAEADCSVRCRPNLFFPERRDCYTDCFNPASVVPYAGASSAPGRPPARLRFLAGRPLTSSQVMEAGGNWAGITPGDLRSEARLQGGGFGCIQAAGSPQLISMFVEMSGFSRPLVARGVTLGTSTAWDLGIGVEVGTFASDWIWIYGQVAGLGGTRDFTVSRNVPEQVDSIGQPAFLDGQNSGFGYKASLGVDLRITANTFLNLSWHYKPSKESYPGGGFLSARKGFDLDATTSIVAAGVSFHAD